MDQSGQYGSAADQEAPRLGPVATTLVMSLISAAALWLAVVAPWDAIGAALRSVLYPVVASPLPAALFGAMAGAAGVGTARLSAARSDTVTSATLGTLATLGGLLGAWITSMVFQVYVVVNPDFPLRRSAATGPYIAMCLAIVASALAVLCWGALAERRGAGRRAASPSR